MACHHLPGIICDECARWQFQRPIQICEHCFCGRSQINGIWHTVCCMCATRRADTPSIQWTVAS